MQLIVYSKSTKKYIDDWEYQDSLLVTGHPKIKIIEKRKTLNQVVAIGGGSVLDTAKIISKNPILAVPTTFAGASRTSHSVYWHKGRKIDVDTEKPVTITNNEYLQSLSDEFLSYTICDCMCHIVDSLISKKANSRSMFYCFNAIQLIKKSQWLNASLLAGDAIEITGTNLTHALSYPLTGKYGVPHAKALTFLLNKLSPLLKYRFLNNFLNSDVQLDFDTELLIQEAFTYPKIWDTKKKFDKELLLRLLK